MRKLSSLVCLSVLALAGCGNGVVTIYDTISPTPTVAVEAGQQVTFTATVINDPSNSGVTWSLNGAVGTLSAKTPTSVVFTAASATAVSSGSVVATPVKNTLYAAATAINLAPALSITTSTLTTGTVGTAYNYQLVASGGSGTLTWALASGSLPAGLTLSPAGLISGTPTMVQTASFSVQVTDSASTPVTVIKALTLTVKATTLSITTASVPNAVAGTAYSVQLAATGGITPYTWAQAGGTLPTGMSISITGVLSGTPSGSGVFTFSAQVTDTEPVPQVVTKQFTFTLYSALVITTTSLPQGSVKNAYSTTLTSTGGTAPVTWSLAAGSTLPSPLTLSSAGVISGTPTAASTTTVTVQATDASSPQQVTTKTFTLTIVLSTLAITTTSVPQGTVGVNYSTQLASTGGNPPVTWAVTSGSTLPGGLTLSSAGVLSGRPTTQGSFSFSVSATDTTPATVSQTITMTVVQLATLTVTTTTVPAGNVGTPYSTTISATGGASPYTWAISAGALPPGLTFSTAGVLSGTPLAAGTYNFTAQVTDSQNTPATASRAFTLTIGLTLATGTGNAMLNGSYAFLLQGFNTGSTNGTAYGTAAIGSLSANGAGAVTGTEDINTPSGVQNSVAVTGTYSVGSDGRGLMVLTAGTATNVYAIAASNLNGAVAQTVALTEFDNSTGATGAAIASGVAKLQTASTFVAATVKGSFVFGLSGESPCSTCATAVKFGPVDAVGAFTADGVSVISAGAEDAGAYATTYNGVTFTGTFAAPSTTTGRGTLALTNTGTLFAAPPVNYTYVIVNAGEMLLMSRDSHATTSLLAGDARLQTITTYTAASLSGALIGYESQGNGGDGVTVYPAKLNAILSRVAITGSGTATLSQDANRAGTLSTTTATAITYTTASNGRTVLATGGNGQVLYPYAAGAGFALDTAATGAYPALIAYEQQVAVAPYPVLLSGSYAAETIAATPATDASGKYVFALSTGGVDSTINGTLVTTLDSSSPAGALALGTTSASLIFVEDANSRLNVTANGSSTTQAVVYGITSKRAVAIPGTSTTTPTVTVLQQ